MRLYELLEDINQAELNQVEVFADKLWSKLGIDVEFTRHFIERLNDERNMKPITAAELVRLFRKEYESYGNAIRKLDDKDEAVMKDLTTQLNLPFVIRDMEDGKALIAKTIMRKPNFYSSSQEFAVK